MSTSKISPHLWYDSQAEEAVDLYVSIFSNSPYGKPARIKSVIRYPHVGQEITGKKPGSVMNIIFELEGQEFYAINGGPQFKFNESVSFIINCKDQAEIDYFWDKLIADGGQESQCGWLKDKFGVSWQVSPDNFDEMAKDLVKFEKAMAAILPMKKIIIADIEAAMQAK